MNISRTLFFFFYRDWKDRTVASAAGPGSRRHGKAVLGLILGSSIISLGLCPIPRAKADVYVRDDEGVPVFSDQSDHPGFRIFFRTDDLPRQSVALRADSSLIPERMGRYSSLIATTAREHALEPALLHAVVMVESGYDPGAVSSRGAVGLMQLMPQTARDYGVSDRRDPAQNLQVGARHLSRLIRQFGGDLELALAAYNAGEHAVRRWGMAIPPYLETRRYVLAVLHRYRLLLRLKPQ